jgi:uncharacterized protein YbjT (DUF2867 family)
MYLIIGASGRLGSRVSRRLLESGQKVRAQSRDPETKLRGLIEQGAEPMRGDLRDDGWLEDAMRGVRRVLLSSQAVFPPSRTNHAGTVDGPGNRKVIDAAKNAGVEHIVFLSLLMADPDFPVRFIRAKFATESYLKSGGIVYTILRPAAFTEMHGTILLGQPLLENSTVQFFGKGETLLRWISVEDVADYVVKSFDDPEDQNATRVISGPDVMSRMEMLQLFERHLGRRAKRRHMPLTLMRVMRTLSAPVHPGLNDLISAAIAEETMPNHPGFAPRGIDWQGSTSVEDVVTRWAGLNVPQPVVAD